MSTSRIDKFISKVSTLVGRHRKHPEDLIPWSKDENVIDLCGVTSPLEGYMQPDEDELEFHVWEILEEHDILIGRVVSVGDHGIFVGLMCFDADKSCNVEKLNIQALCPKSEIPILNNHDNPLLRFSAGDLVRGSVLSFNSHDTKIILTFHSRNVKYMLRLGEITEDDLPVSYKRSLASTESYDELLQMSSGFYNPYVIDYLAGRLVYKQNSSFIKDLDNLRCSPKETAIELRKRQSSKIAAKCVAKGVSFCRKGQTIEALQEFNHALDLDPSNIDALVGRGALYANKSAYSKAIADFELALKHKPGHKNAKKYLIEVLLEHAQSIEEHITDIAQVRKVEQTYHKVLLLDPCCNDATEALGLIKNSEKYRKLRKSATESASSHSDSSGSESSMPTAAIKKVKQILEHDVQDDVKQDLNERKAHRRKEKSQSRSSSSSSSSATESSSSSSSSTSSSSTSQSSPSPKRKAKKRKRSSSVISNKRLCREKKTVNNKKLYNSSDLPKSSRTPKTQSRNERCRRNSMSKSDIACSNRDVVTKNWRHISSPLEHKKQASITGITDEISQRRRTTSQSSRDLHKDHNRETGVESKHANSERVFDSRHCNFPFSDNNRGNMNFYSGDRSWQRRQSNSFVKLPQRPTESDPVNKPQEKAVESKPITKVDKTTFSSILDQITRFENKRKTL